MYSQRSTHHILRYRFYIALAGILVAVPTLVSLDFVLTHSSQTTPKTPPVSNRLDIPKTYKDSLGRDQPIDLTIQKTGGSYSYQNETNVFKSYFKNSPSDNGAVKFSNSLGSIAFYTPNEQNFGNLKSPDSTEANGSSITYKDVFDGLDLKYTISPTQLLEEFLVKDNNSAHNFHSITQEAVTTGVDGYHLENGAIIFTKKDKQVFIVPRPVLYEVGNPNQKSYGIFYSVNSKGNEEYQISKNINNDGRSWLNDPSRHYPIAIDLVIDNADAASNWVSSDGINMAVSQETSIVQQGTGSVKLAALSYAGDGADGSFSAAVSPGGTGADGAISTSTNFNLNTGTSGSRTYADGIAYRVIPPTSDATTITRFSGSDTLTNGIAANDEILVIDLQGTSGDNSAVGNYEFAIVQSITASTITLSHALSTSFTGTSGANQKVIVQRVPNYTNVTLSSTASLTASAWEGLATTPTGAAGYLTGIVAFRANGTVSVGASASISTSNLGYSGGAGGTGSSGGINGESYDGSIGSGGGQGAAGTSGGGGGDGNSAASSGRANTGAGAGGGGDNSTQVDDGGGGGGGGSYATGGGGGGGGADCSATGGAGGIAANSSGGGGGSGAAACGAGAAGGGGSFVGGGTKPGAAGVGTTGGGGGGSTGTGTGAGGGGGGSSYGISDLSKIYFGSGGGGGGADSTNPGSQTNGGRGGGIIFIGANTLTVSGTVSANGANGATANNGYGGSGGGAGGSVLIRTSSGTLGSSLVSATGGAAAAASARAGGGGGGGGGRINVIAGSLSGTTNPTSPSNTYSFNVEASGSRTYADGIAYKVSSNPSGTSIVTTTTPNGIATDDEVLLINLQGTTGDIANVGNYEFLQVASVNTGARTITTTTPIQNSYGGTTFSNQKIIVQRVPHYTSFTLTSSSPIISASSWDGLTQTPTGTAGFHTGIVAFRATGTVSVGSGASISTASIGFRGGQISYKNIGGVNGESYDGIVGAGGVQSAAGTSGGGGGDGGSAASSGRVSGGGGGGGADNSGQVDDGGGGGGGGSYATGGGGGGGGADCSATGGLGGSSGSSVGGGGGTGGTSCTAGSAGGNGGSAGGGTKPGAAGVGTTGGGGGGSTGTGTGAGGGGGGSSYGSATLSTMFMGSGGGAGGGSVNGGVTASGVGGSGGGIIFIGANTLTILGTITANGGAGRGATLNAGAGGSGSGGSILIQAGTATLGSTLLTSSGGASTTRTTTAGGGGGGGDGRIRIAATTQSGSTSPAASTTTTPLFSLNQSATLTTYATDLTNQMNITFYVRSHRTGTFGRFQFGEVASNEQTYDFTINSADTWELKTWDITGIAASSKNAVTKYAFVITNADVTANLYFDNIQSHINQPPNTPTLDAPTNAAANQSVFPVLKTTATDAEGNNVLYKIVVCTDATMTTGCQTFDQTASTTGWSATSYASGVQGVYTVQTALIQNATYYWDSYAIDPAGSNTWSTTQGTSYSFTTSHIPAIPSLDLPLSGASTSTFPILKTTSTDPDSDYLRYKIQLCTDSYMTTGCQTFDQTSSQTGWSGQNAQISTAYTSNAQATYTVQAALSPSTGYYWRSYAIDPGGSDAWSSTQSTLGSFITNLPGIPTLLSPGNTTTSVSLKPTLQLVALDNAGNYLRYKIIICTDIGMSVDCQTFDQTISQTGWSGQNAQTNTAYTSGTIASYTISTALTSGTTYYWQGYSIAPGGPNVWSSPSNEFSFTASSTPTAATGCVLHESRTDSSLNLAWTHNAINNAGYEVRRAVDGGAFGVLATGLSATATSYADATVTDGHTYQYEVAPYFTGPIYGAWCQTSTLSLQLGTLKLQNIKFQ